MIPNECYLPQDGSREDYLAKARMPNYEIVRHSTVQAGDYLWMPKSEKWHLVTTSVGHPTKDFCLVRRHKTVILLEEMIATCRELQPELNVEIDAFFSKIAGVPVIHGHIDPRRIQELKT